jgi:hypothetical protein
MLNVGAESGSTLEIDTLRSIAVITNNSVNMIISTVDTAGRSYSQILTPCFACHYAEEGAEGAREGAELGRILLAKYCHANNRICTPKVTPQISLDLRVL